MEGGWGWGGWGVEKVERNGRQRGRKSPALPPTHGKVVKIESKMLTTFGCVCELRYPGNLVFGRVLMR